MDGIPAQYQGRVVSKEHFRAFIYAPDGRKKLVNSWDEYEKWMASGEWFSTRDDANASVAITEEKKPKRGKK